MKGIRESRWPKEGNVREMGRTSSSPMYGDGLNAAVL